MTAVGAVKTIGTAVLLQPRFCRGHIFHAVGTVVGVHLVANTETTPGQKGEDSRETLTNHYLMSRQCLQKYNLHIGLRLPQLQRYCT